jgi:hypothetical protein
MFVATSFYQFVDTFSIFNKAFHSISFSPGRAVLAGLANDNVLESVQDGCHVLLLRSSPHLLGPGP